MSHVEQDLPFATGGPFFDTRKAKSRDTRKASKMQEKRREVTRADWRHEGALQAFLNSISEAKFLTGDEEKVLGQRVQKVMHWEAMLRVLEGRVSDVPDSMGTLGVMPLGRKVTKAEWAQACGFENVEEFSFALRRGRAAKETFIASNLPLVVSIAKRFRLWAGSLTLLDLIQEGTLGLVRAIEKYDPDRGFKFSTYATPWVRQAVGRAIETKAHMIRLSTPMHQSLRDLSKAITEISARTGRPPTDVELMERLQCSKKRLTRLLETKARGLAMAIEDLPDFNPPADTKTAPPGEVDALKSDVAAWLETLPTDEADLVRLHFGIGGLDAMSYPEMAKCLGISRNQVSYRVQCVLAKMRDQRHEYEELRDYLTYV